MTFKFNRHNELEGKHSFLSPSKYHWVNYDDEKILISYDKHMTAALGTRLHAWAAETIKLGLHQPDNSKTINMYVNDCIGYRMSIEVPLAYSVNAFGTADAIWYGPHPDTEAQWASLLRIYDLKNGASPSSKTQLECYAALFCLEYRVRPMEIDYDLRIYQNDEVVPFVTDPEDIAYIMDRYIVADRLIESMKEV
jgi:hypothetical protein